MLDRNEFGTERNRERKPAACVAWTELLPDAAEGLLSESEARALDLHVAGCAVCSQELADARRGVAWLGLLKDYAPEPPADLLSNILARTTGADDLLADGFHSQAAPLATVPGVVLPGQMGLDQIQPTRLAALRVKIGRWLGVSSVYVPALQPRLTMTAAMAFLSICLTLNLVGIPVNNLHAETLRPAGLQRAVADKGASLLRSIQGLRTVYRVESRVNEWLTASALQGGASTESGR